MKQSFSSRLSSLENTSELRIKHHIPNQNVASKSNFDQRLSAIEEDIIILKEPLTIEVNNLRRENESILRELDRLMT